MQLFLRVVGGSQRGQRLHLRAGQTARVGRTDWNDFSFPTDDRMSEGHFLIRCASDGCWIRANSEADTLVNGQKVMESRLRNGDVVRAGNTEFAVTIEGDLSGDGTSAIDAAVAGTAVAAEAAAEEKLVDVCALLGLDDAVQEVARRHKSREDLIAELTKKETYAAAIRLRAHWLPKREAVWWGYRCVEMAQVAEGNAEQRMAHQAALRWANAPEEEARRACEAAAEACGLRGAAAFLALGAFWSGGSVSPEGMPPVPPDEKLTGQGVTAALIMAAHPPGSRDFKRRFQEFLTLGKRLADGLEVAPWSKKEKAKA